MITGALLVCPHCGGCVELLRELVTAAQIEASPDDYRCDCGGVLELFGTDDDVQAERRAA